MIPFLIVFVLLLQRYSGQDTNGYDCSPEDIKFDKIIGVRPRDTTLYKLLFKNTTPSAITTDCFKQCSADKFCTNFILFYNNSACYEFTNGDDSKLVYSDNSLSTDYVIDSNVAFFVKICINIPNSCRVKLWPIERIPGSTLVTTQSKQVDGYLSRQQCAQYCLNENKFVCRSANFKQALAASTGNMSGILGTCWLNDGDRHTLPNSFRVSNYGDEYIENQCVNISAAKDYCSYEEYTNSVLKHVDVAYFRISRDNCQQNCEQQLLFNCHGFSLIPHDDLFDCLLHSEDTQVLGPKMLMLNKNATYFERARCLNLSVSCTNTDMYIKYSPDVEFQGRVYMFGHSEEADCNVKGNGNQSITLQIELVDQKCGISEAKSVGPRNRTLLGGYLIIQYNALIQTQGDRFVKVGCLLDNDLNDLTENVTLGASVQFNSSLPGQGTVIINNSTVNPIVKILVVDPVTNVETTDVQIGQELQFRIEIEPADGPYDIWAGHLVAKTENGQDSILLLDDRGCPVNPAIFPALTKTRTPTKRILFSNFSAFKFTVSSVVRFTVTVHFCTLNCPPMLCTNNVRSFGKRKRNIPAGEENVTVVWPSNFTDSSPEINATVMSLEYFLVVHDDRISPDRLVIGDGKILIAGYDVIRDQFCMDYSLLIGILVVWFIIQLIILIGCIMVVRRYRKYYDIAYDRQSLSDIHNNFGLGCSNLNRRVHWADQNCPQCPHSILE